MARPQAPDAQQYDEEPQVGASQEVQGKYSDLALSTSPPVITRQSLYVIFYF